MPRRLTAARATVPPDRRTAYLDAVRELAAAHHAAGGRFWLFERDGASGEFLEFAEHASRSPAGVASAALAAQLAALASYDATRDEQWHEVPPAAGGGD